MFMANIWFPWTCLLSHSIWHGTFLLHIFGVSLNITCSLHSSLFSLLLSSAGLTASVLVNQLLGAQLLWLVLTAHSLRYFSLSCCLVVDRVTDTWASSLLPGQCDSCQSHVRTCFGFSQNCGLSQFKLQPVCACAGSSLCSALSRPVSWSEGLCLSGRGAGPWSSETQEKLPDLTLSLTGGADRLLRRTKTLTSASLIFLICCETPYL